MRRFRRLPIVGLVVAAVLFVTGQAVAEGSADLAITRMTGPHIARVGDTVAVSVTTVDRGPDRADIATIITTSDNLQLELVDCNGDAGGGDGANCEPGSLIVPPGHPFSAVGHIAVLGGGSRVGKVTACASDIGGVSVDPQPRNNCRSIDILIVGKPGKAKSESEIDRRRRGAAGTRPGA